ncbi:MAG: AbiH family protein [Dysgonomonas sp.]|uniref:AbiH family protein n=1 Tax=Dysgonomonas sp. TaxID=1891233 RepID=UPI003A84F0ED
MNDRVPIPIRRPNNILFFNFNYTTIPNQYIIKDSDVNSIHIHGELNNPKNPIIFGYGDELAEDYKQIENLNDNEYLKNVKSIRYLDTDNYRRILSFIESESYQIFIMGHSCGNSDRTLLNTLFEHKNCVSIKPFYHLREDSTDNYNEIVQNISRNFTNKAAMRERVVNKTYCEPLT